MRKSKFTESQIVAILAEGESGFPSSSVHGASMLISLGFILKRAPTRG